MALSVCSIASNVTAALQVASGQFLADVAKATNLFQQIGFYNGCAFGGHLKERIWPYFSFKKGDVVLAFPDGGKPKEGKRVRRDGTAVETYLVPFQNQAVSFSIFESPQVARFGALVFADLENLNTKEMIPGFFSKDIARNFLKELGVYQGEEDFCLMQLLYFSIGYSQYPFPAIDFLLRDHENPHLAQREIRGQVIFRGNTIYLLSMKGSWRKEHYNWSEHVFSQFTNSFKVQADDSIPERCRRAWPFSIFCGKYAS